MKSLFATKANPAALTRRHRIGVASLLLVLTVASMAEAVTFARSSTGTWRERASTYVAQVEYLFFPNSGAGARLDFNLAEESIGAP